MSLATAILARLDESRYSKFNPGDPVLVGDRKGQFVASDGNRGVKVLFDNGEESIVPENLVFQGVSDESRS